MSEKKSAKPKKPKRNYAITLQVAMSEKKMSRAKTRHKLVKALAQLGMAVYDVRITEISDRRGTGEDTSN